MAVVDAILGSLLLRDLPANVTTWDFGLAVGNKCLALIPHPITAIIPIKPKIPVSLAVAIAVLTNQK
jgi:hypothetical protein